MEWFDGVSLVAALDLVVSQCEVMAIQSNRIAIPFRPLLGQMVDFSEPVYDFIDKARNNACVRVKTENGKSEFVFFGGEANAVHESQERAAQKAVQKLMSHFGVRSNLGKKSSDEVLHVTIDFVGFLGVIVTQTGADVSPLETIWVKGLGFVAWLTVTCLHSRGELECIYSDACPEINSAMQKAAKRAIHYLVTRYNLEIVDANYGVSLEKSAACSALKERFYQLKRCLAAREEMFADDECLTPNSKRNQIPKISLPPAAPIRRRSTTPLSAASSSRTEPLVYGIPELETVWKRAKFV
uniref:DRBM domain-containing protein n=2 Tax=Chenopodium quinoa TaxID=63459 RepID=A0A803MXM4_CHEQI